MLLQEGFGGGMRVGSTLDTMVVEPLFCLLRVRVSGHIPSSRSFGYGQASDFIPRAPQLRQSFNIDRVCSTGLTIALSDGPFNKVFPRCRANGTRIEIHHVQPVFYADGLI